MPRAFVAIFALGLVAAIAVGGFSVALENAGEDNTVTNETFTPSAGTVTQLDNSNLGGAYYADSVDVYNNSGDLMVDGTDYEWFDSNGTIKPLSGGDLAGDPSANITYEYQQTTEQQREMAKFLALLPKTLGLIAPGLVIVVLLLLLRG